MQIEVPTTTKTHRSTHRFHKSMSADKILKYYNQSKENRKVLNSPISGYDAKQLFPELLTENDYEDIADYEEIYYLTKIESSEPTQFEGGFEFFKFKESAHIAFRFEQIQFLGRGSFGTVVKCFDHKTKKYVAIKVILNEEEDRKQIDYEVNYLKKLADHENGSLNHHVLNLIDTFVFRQFYCIVTELNYTDLYTHMKSHHFAPLGHDQVRDIARQLADALAFIHSAGIAHSDIKPENIMFTDKTKSNIAVIDFGCACFDRHPLYKVVQSLYYRSPEVIFNFRYGCEIDVWSYGCVLFELATGKPLFHTRNEDELISMITDIVGAPPLEMITRSKKMKNYYEQEAANRAKCEAKKKSIISGLMQGSDSDLIDLVCACLQWIPAKRLTMKQVLEHPYFKKN